MARVEIVESLYDEIDKKFKKDSVKVLQHLKSLESSPHKGKTLGNVGGVLIKEIKFKGFRFYFLIEGFKLKIFTEEELVDLLLKFVRMSDKKQQKETIEEIRKILIKIGPGGLF